MGVLEYNKLNIQSDFVDYYDYLSSKDGIVYNRKLSDSLQRATALKKLKMLGVRTIELKQVSQFNYLDGDLVVYTDVKKHHGLGKKLCSHGEAVEIYRNFAASKFIYGTKGITLKYLQIGSRQFRLTFQREDELSLELGRLIDIIEVGNDYNWDIQRPIFSVDYISVDGLMVATDYNEVEDLGRLGIHQFISPSEVERQVVNALITYNKF